MNDIDFYLESNLMEELGMSEFKINDRVIIKTEVESDPINNAIGKIISKDVNDCYFVYLDTPDQTDMHVISMSRKCLQISDTVKQNVITPKLLVLTLYGILSEFMPYVELDETQKLSDLTKEVETLKSHLNHVIDLAKASNSIISENDKVQM